MDFTVKKVNNCFADRQTYEYSIGENCNAFLDRLEEGYTVRINDKLRRPVFVADNPSTGINIKGMLEASVIKVSFPEEGYEQHKSSFEDWLGEQ